MRAIQQWSVWLLVQAVAALALLACDSAPASVPTAQPEPENLPIVELPSTSVPTAEPVRLPTMQPPATTAPTEPTQSASIPTVAPPARSGPTALPQSVRIPLVQQPNSAPTPLSQSVRIPLVQQPNRGAAQQPPPATNPKCANGGHEAYGSGSPDVEAKIQQALAVANITARVRTGTFGEADGCDVFHAAALDVGVVVQAQDLSDQATLVALATQIDGIVRQIHAQTKVAPNLGKLQISFTANGATCAWDASSRVCKSE